MPIIGNIIYSFIFVKGITVMSTSLTNVQQTEFDALVKIEYRSRGFLLRDAVRIRTDIIGNTCQFRKIGQVIANPVAYQNTIAIQDPGITAQTAILQKYAAGTGVDSIQDLTVNFDSRRELAYIVAMAIGRRSDQIILDAMSNAVNTTGNAAPAGSNVSAYPTVTYQVTGELQPNGTAYTAETNMSVAKLRMFVEYFERDAVPVEQRFCALTGCNLRSLLYSDRILSRFYTSNDAAVDGTLNYKELFGMNMRVIPDMSEGGLPTLTGGTVNSKGYSTARACFAWHSLAVGMAIGQDMRTEVSYLPRETTYFVNGLFFGGATVVDPRGFFVAQTDETAGMGGN